MWISLLLLTMSPSAMYRGLLLKVYAKTILTQESKTMLDKRCHVVR